jgi:hypothetical protein
MSENKRILIGSPYICGPGDQVPLTVDFPWATTVTITTADNTDVKAYRLGDDQETDVAGTLFPTGTHSYSANSITLRTMKSMTAGEKYSVKITPTIDGAKKDYWFEVWCLSNLGAI